MNKCIFFLLFAILHFLRFNGFSLKAGASLKLKYSYCCCAYVLLLLQIGVNITTNPLKATVWHVAARRCCHSEYAMPTLARAFTVPVASCKAAVAALLTSPHLFAPYASCYVHFETSSYHINNYIYICVVIHLAALRQHFNM